MSDERSMNEAVATPSDETAVSGELADSGMETEIPFKIELLKLDDEPIILQSKPY